MSWYKYSILFGLASFKFMFAPIAGLPMHLNFFETYFSVCAGALVTAVFFYYSSAFFIQRNINKKQQKIIKAMEEGFDIPFKKRFTFVNKLIIRIKRGLGIYGICFWAPLFLSIPGGTIIATRMYPQDKRTLPLIILGIFINALIITTIVYHKIIFGRE